MAKKRFCSACGRDLAKDGGDPKCVGCAPKVQRPAFAVLTHSASRSRHMSPYLRPVSDCKAVEIERETPILIHLKGGSRWDARHYGVEAPLRFATMEAAEAFLTAAKEATADVTSAHIAAIKAASEAREA